MKLFLKLPTFELYLNFYFYEDDEPMILFIDFWAERNLNFVELFSLLRKKILVCVAIQIFAIQAWDYVEFFPKLVQSTCASS